MSNALSPVAEFAGMAGQPSFAVLAETTGPEQTNDPFIWFIAAGVLVWGLWIVSAAANPSKLTLRRTPARPNTLHPLHILLPLAAFVLALGTLTDLLSVWLPAEGPRLTVLSTVGMQTLWLVTSLLVAGFTFRHGLGRGLGLSVRRWKYDTAAAVAACLAAFPVCFALAWAFSKVVPPEMQHPHRMLTAVDKLSGGWAILILLSVLVLAPLCEEIFFRGLLQSIIRKYTGSPWTAILVASVPFALLHFDQPQHMVALFALGVILGYNYERQGRLYAPIGVHMLFNAVNLVGWLAR